MLLLFGLESHVDSILPGTHEPRSAGLVWLDLAESDEPGEDVPLCLVPFLDDGKWWQPVVDPALMCPLLVVVPEPLVKPRLAEGDVLDSRRDEGWHCLILERLVEGLNLAV